MLLKLRCVLLIQNVLDAFLDPKSEFWDQNLDCKTFFYQCRSMGCRRLWPRPAVLSKQK